MPSAGLEPVIPATKRPQTYALDRAVTGIGSLIVLLVFIYRLFNDAVNNYGYKLSTY
jgi:hypothetical protein